MTMAEAMLTLEVSHKLHVLRRLSGADQSLPVGDRLAVFLLDRGEVGCRPLHFFGHRRFPSVVLAAAGADVEFVAAFAVEFGHGGHAGFGFGGLHRAPSTMLRMVP